MCKLPSYLVLSANLFIRIHNQEEFKRCYKLEQISCEKNVIEFVRVEYDLINLQTETLKCVKTVNDHTIY